VFTRKVSSAGKGLILDQTTRIHLHGVAAAYRGEYSIQEGENLHCPLCSKNELLREVMLDVKDLPERFCTAPKSLQTFVRRYLFGNPRRKPAIAAAQEA
jgi:hypothetical protein